MSNTLNVILINRLKDTDLDVRVAALYAINNRLKKSKVDDVRLPALLRDQAKSQHHEVKTNAFIALRSYIDNQAEDILKDTDLKALVEDNFHASSEVVRSNSLYIFAEILLQESQIKIAKKKIKDLLEIAYDDPSEDVKTNATYVLSTIVIKDIAEVDDYELQDEIEILCRKYQRSVSANIIQRKVINDALSILTASFIKRQRELQSSLGKHKAATAVELLLKRDRKFSASLNDLTIQVEEFNKELIKLQIKLKSQLREKADLGASHRLLEHEISRLQQRIVGLELKLKGNPLVKHLILPSGFRYAEYVLKYREACSPKLIQDLGWHVLVRLPLLVSPIVFIPS